MRIALTGSSGYLASLIVPKLSALPAVEAVLALDVRPLRPETARLPKVRAETADVRTADLARLFSADGPVGPIDCVVHLAFIVAPIRDAAAIYDISVAGSERVFDAAAAAGVKHIVYASSIAAYGRVRGHALPLREETPRVDQRDFYYAHTKWLVEEALDRFEQDHPEIAVARLRPGIFLGSSPEADVSRAFGPPVILGFDGQAPAQFTYDHDVADAFVLAVEKRARGAFLVTTEDEVALEEVGAILGKPTLRAPGWLLDGAARAVEASGLEAFGPIHRGWVEAARAPMIATSAKARAELGWRPKCPTSRDALRRFAEVAGPGPGARRLLAGLQSIRAYAAKVMPAFK